jgi:uncharacterized protein involved in response to NO
MAGVPRIPYDYSGPALFSYGFRPFFFAGSVWAALSVLLWMAQFYGVLKLANVFPPRDWHIHEMLYGYVPAVIAGFLLTAIPTWTGRLPVAGVPLSCLLSLWLVGRVAVLVSETIGATPTAVADLAFLVVLAAAAFREVVAGENWRNIRILGVLAAFIAGNIVFHVEVSVFGAADYAVRIGIASAIILIMLIGGRIVPSFTHNFLLRSAGGKEPGRLPCSFSTFDAVSIAGGVIALAAWIAIPASMVAGWLLLFAGALHVVRLARWAGDRVLADRLVLALHVGYSFVPIGFVLAGIASLGPEIVPTSAGAHAWTVGAIGIMTLAVMTRATLGHTGRALYASRPTEVLYTLAIVAAIARITASLGFSDPWLNISAIAWIAAFAGFALVYGPMLLSWSRKVVPAS